MFAELRDLNFSAVGLYLSKEAKKITEAYKVSGNLVYDVVSHVDLCQCACGDFFFFSRRDMEPRRCHN